MCLLVVQFRYKYDRFVLKQMLFPSKPSPDVSHSLRSPHDQPPSPRTDKERSLVSYFLGTLPRRQVILETATKERYLLTPKRADGSSYMAVSDARKVRWAYDISLILEQEVIVEDVKDEPTEPPVISEPTQELLEDSSVVPSALSSKETGKAAEVADKEEGELESSGGGEALPTAVKPQPDKDGDVEMGSGDKEPGELNEDGENAEAPQLPQAGPSSTAPAALTPPTPAQPPLLKLDTVNLAPSRSISRVPSARESPAPTVPLINTDVSMADIDDDVDGGDDSFVTLIRGEDENGNEQSVHYPVQMLQRHVTENMLRFEDEGIYVKEASFVGPTVPPSPTTSVAGTEDGRSKMDVVLSYDPDGQPIEWRMQVVSWKWAGQAWIGY